MTETYIQNLLLSINQSLQNHRLILLRLNDDTIDCYLSRELESKNIFRAHDDIICLRK